MVWFSGTLLLFGYLFSTLNLNTATPPPLVPSLRQDLDVKSRYGLRNKLTTIILIRWRRCSRYWYLNNMIVIIQATSIDWEINRQIDLDVTTIMRQLVLGFRITQRTPLWIPPTECGHVFTQSRSAFFCNAPIRSECVTQTECLLNAPISV